MVGALSTTPSLHSSACPLPKPPCHPPAPSLVRGFQGLGRISAACKVPRVVRESLGWHMASRYHTMVPLRCSAVLAGSRRQGGGDQECHVPCRERAVPPPRVAPAGCPMAAPRLHCQGKKQPHQKYTLPDGLQAAVVITRKTLPPSTTTSHLWF